MTPLDLDRFRVPETPSLPQNAEDMGRVALPIRVRGQLFLKGPIPWTWLLSAMRLAGKALHVAVLVWFVAGMKRSAVVKLNVAALREAGVSRWSAARGLRALEGAGLVKVARGPGRRPVVTLVAHDPVPGGPGQPGEGGANDDA
jgi:hypothetical protein